jgi:ABC-type glycerol-3-phosphate transport system substrate-binding protein
MDIAFVPMPQSSLWVGGFGWAMSSGSKNKEAAWELMKWMTATNEGAVSFFTHFEGWTPAKANVPEFIELAKTDPIMELTLQGLEQAERNHLVSHVPVNYQQEFEEKWAEVMNGTLAPKAFLDHMTQYIQTLLDEAE